MKETTYSNAKAQQLQNTSSVRIYGEVLEREANTPIGTTARKEPFLPISPCFCVHDSPDNPCPCGSGLIIWIPVDQILSSGKLEDREDKDLHYFDVRKDADLLIERMYSFKASVYKNRKSLSSLSGASPRIQIDESIEELLDLLKTPPTFPEPDKGGGDTVLYSWRSILGAFKVGWKIGRFIDEKTGLSDQIADWLCEKDPDCWSD